MIRLLLVVVFGMLVADTGGDQRNETVELSGVIALLERSDVSGATWAATTSAAGPASAAK